MWGHYRFTDVYAAIPVVVAALCALAVVVTPARNRRKVAVRLTAMAIVGVPAIFLFDFAYTLAQPGFRQPHFFLDGGSIDRRYSMADPQLGFVRKPHVSYRAPTRDRRRVSYRTDENGFRNPPGTTRADVVFLGDSFTEAALIPEEQTFVRRVAAETGLGVVNLGRGAYGPQQELIVLERVGLSYQPKVVVWQLFEGNDPSDAENFATWLANPEPPPLAVRYINNSLIGRALEPTTFRGPSRIRVVIRHRDGTQERKELRYRFAPDQAETLARAFADTQKTVAAGARLCASRGSRLIVLFIPTMVQVLEPFMTFDPPEDRERALPGGAVRSERDFGNRLKAACRAPECSYVDAFDALRARALVDHSRVYDRDDPDEHLDVDGHDVVARLIVDAIQPTRANAELRRR